VSAKISIITPKGIRKNLRKNWNSKNSATLAEKIRFIKR
jgi:hypothetical protein